MTFGFLSGSGNFCKLLWDSCEVLFLNGYAWIHWVARSCTTTAYRWLFRNSQLSLRTLWSAVIKSPNPPARGMAPPPRSPHEAPAILASTDPAISVLSGSVYNNCCSDSRIDAVLRCGDARKKLTPSNSLSDECVFLPWPSLKWKSREVENLRVGDKAQRECQWRHACLRDSPLHECQWQHLCLRGTARCAHLQPQPQSVVRILSGRLSCLDLHTHMHFGSSLRHSSHLHTHVHVCGLFTLILRFYFLLYLAPLFLFYN